jgi:hypothetical protein
MIHFWTRWDAKDRATVKYALESIISMMAPASVATVRVEVRENAHQEMGSTLPWTGRILMSPNQIRARG